MMCLADETQISSGIFCAYLLFSAQRKCPSDDTRFALSLPLRGPLPFTSRSTTRRGPKRRRHMPTSCVTTARR